MAGSAAPCDPRTAPPRAARCDIACWVVCALLVAPTAPSQGAPQPESHQTFDQRLAACPPEDIRGRLRLIDWALQNNLANHAEALYREILLREPEHDEAYEGLLQLADQRPLPSTSDAYRATKALLPKGFRKYETQRFIVLSNADARWTRAQANLLERTYHEFFRHTERLQLRPLPLRHKLVCVLFRKRSQFAEFAQRHDRVTESWGLGYYSPRHDRTVFYNGAAEPGADQFARKRSIATTIHEATHQLHYHTHVQIMHVQYPLWSCEGLATAFETSNPNAAFGPDHEFQPRRERFLRLLKGDRILPLRSLVGLDRMPDNRTETIHTVYNQSYALVSWLARYRKQEFRDYLMLMLKEPPGRLSPNRHLALFEQAFGNIDQVERSWLLYEIRQLGWNNIDQPLLNRQALAKGEAELFQAHGVARGTAVFIPGDKGPLATPGKGWGRGWTFGGNLTAGAAWERWP